MQLSVSEENYLKALYKLTANTAESVGTNVVARELQTSAASVTSMLQRLGAKALVHYESYRGAKLSEDGQRIAMSLIRRHRLWETFLVDKLNLNWDEVHEIAEQLEHINNDKLVDRLDAYLGYPRVDPHGDPIPDAKGNIERQVRMVLAELPIGQRACVVRVTSDEASFLQHLDWLGLRIGSCIEVIQQFEFDESLLVRLDQEREQNISRRVSELIRVSKEA